MWSELDFLYFVVLQSLNIVFASLNLLFLQLSQRPLSLNSISNISEGLSELDGSFEIGDRVYIA